MTVCELKPQIASLKDHRHVIVCGVRSERERDLWCSRLEASAGHPKVLAPILILPRAGVTADFVCEELRRQMQDPQSALKQGKYTSTTIEVTQPEPRPHYDNENLLEIVQMLTSRWDGRSKHLRSDFCSASDLFVDLEIKIDSCHEHEGEQADEEAEREANSEISKSKGRAKRLDWVTYNER